MSKNRLFYLALVCMILCFAGTFSGRETVRAMDVLGGAGAGAMSHHGSGSSGEGQAEAEAPKRTYLPTDTIKPGVYAGGIDLSGLTASEAETEIGQYVSSLGEKQLTLNAVSNNSVTVTFQDIGLGWGNPEIVDDAMGLGKAGNIVKRFKDMSDLKRTNKIYPIELTVNDDKVRNILTEDCAAFNVEAVDSGLTKGANGFEIVEGHDGRKVDVDASAQLIETYATEEFRGEDASLDLVIRTEKPKADPGTLSQVKDVLGTFRTKYTSSGADRCANVQNGCRLINGTVLYPGDQLSVLNTITPFTEENGYKLAGSYLNGQVVESFGGGICQVSTTLYQAVLRAELQVDERHNHSMVVNYVDHSADAAIAESSGKDFKFTNNTDYPIFIEGITPGDKTITFTIYGVETRPKNRSVEFESVTLEEKKPEGEIVTADASQPAGWVKKQSAHIGYKAELYKIVKEDGEEKERTKVNSSVYNPSPASLIVGTATSNPVTAQALNAAIATQNIDYCRAVAASVGIDGGAGALATQQATAAAAAQPQDVEIAPEAQQAEGAQ
ncbi:MAG: VanW family protein [Lachnospiraceae bacterium]|nr:VanW family protein [Lachnospiraceae bacterium]